MPVAFVCPLCKFQRKFSDAALGRAVRCDQCGAKIRVVNATSFTVVDATPKKPSGAKPVTKPGEPTWQGDAVTLEPETVIPDNVETKLGAEKPRPEGAQRVEGPAKKQHAQNQHCPMCDAEIDSATMAMGRIRCPKCRTTFEVK